MRAEPYTRSPQIRVDHPAVGSGSEPHPRALEMAEAMREIAAIGGGVTYRDLVGAGFTAAEIIEHHPAAERLAKDASTRQVSPSPDLMAEMVDKARQAWPNRMPLPAGARENQALFQHWGRYCAARAAYKLDCWSGQRERCLDTLTDFLDRLPLLPRDRKQIVRAVAATLAQPAGMKAPEALQ